MAGHAGEIFTTEFEPPLHWTHLSGYLVSRGAACCEQVIAGRFVRTLRLGDATGWLVLAPELAQNRVRVELAPSLAGQAAAAEIRVRRLLDLGAPMGAVSRLLGGDAQLGPLLRKAPGLRVPGCCEGFEIALRGVLGQQISVKAATTVYRRFMAAFGEPLATPFPGLDCLAPDAQRIAEVPIETLMTLGLMRRRAETVHHLSRAVADGQISLNAAQPAAAVMAALEELPGIGPWTSQYVAMRALADRDVFPRADLGLLKALGVSRAGDLEARAEPWRPFRSYAAMHLWRAASAGG